jgi:hypothetical protein
MPIPLRADFNAQTARAAAKRSKDGPQARRLLALAAIYEGDEGATRERNNPTRRQRGCPAARRSTSEARTGSPRACVVVNDDM